MKIPLLQKCVLTAAFCGLAVLPLAVAAAEDAAPAGEKVEEEIVVLATRSEKSKLEVPAHVSTVDFATADAEGWSAGADELRAQPGIFFRRGEGDNDSLLFVSFRGITGNHGNDAFLALVDGIPFVGGDEEVLMDEIPYAAVDQIEIVRGPVSALYGRGGIAGAVNYALSQPAGNKTSLGLAAGSDSYFNLHGSLARQLGAGSLFLSADGLASEGWREQNENRRYNLFARLVMPLSERVSLSSYLNATDRDYELGSVIPTTRSGEPVEVFGGRETFLGSRDTNTQNESWMFASRLSAVLAADRLFEAVVHGRDRSADNVLDFYDTFAFDPSRNVMGLNGFDSREDEKTAFFEASYGWQTEKTASLLGASFERLELEESDFWTGQNGFSFECGFAFYLIEVDYSTGQVLNRNHPCWVERQHNLSGDTTNRFSSAFGQTEVTLGDRLKLTLGGRFDEFERDTRLETGPDRTVQPLVSASESHFSPKVSLVYAASASSSFYFNFGEGFASNFGPVWQWDPSVYLRDTRPTTLRSFEVGTKGLLAEGRFSYSLSLYSIDQKDRLIFLTNPEAFVDFTAPSTLVQTGQKYHSEGLELTAAWRNSRGGTFELRYGYVDAEWEELVIETFAGPVDLSGTAPTGVPENSLYLSWRQRFGDKLEGGLSWESYDDYFLTQNNLFRGGDYDLLNFTLALQTDLAALAQVQLAVTNVLDEDYFYFFGGRTAVQTAVPGLPRQARLTLRFDF